MAERQNQQSNRTFMMKKKGLWWKLCKWWIKKQNPMTLACSTSRDVNRCSYELGQHWEKEISILKNSSTMAWCVLARHGGDRCPGTCRVSLFWVIGNRLQLLTWVKYSSSSRSLREEWNMTGCDFCNWTSLSVLFHLQCHSLKKPAFQTDSRRPAL